MPKIVIGGPVPQEITQFILVGKTVEGKTVTMAEATPEFQAYALAIITRQVNDLFFELPDVIPLKLTN
jgi:hypothetical protein